MKSKKFSGNIYFWWRGGRFKTLFTLCALWTLFNIGVQERGYLIYSIRNTKENRQTMLILIMHSFLSIIEYCLRRKQTDFYRLLANYSKKNRDGGLKRFNYFNSFQSSVGFYIEISDLFCNANRANIKQYTGLNWANIRTFVDKRLLGWCLCWLRKFLVSRKFVFADVWNTHISNSWFSRNLFFVDNVQLYSLLEFIFMKDDFET